MDALQESLGEMEKKNPSRNLRKRGSLTGPIILGWRRLRHSPEAADLKKPHVDVRENDYHQDIPIDSPILSYHVDKDGTRSFEYGSGRSLQFPYGGSSRQFPPDNVGYLPDLVQARRLAAQGNPLAEMYLNRAYFNYFKTQGKGLREDIGSPANKLMEEIKGRFREFHRQPSEEISDLLSGIDAIQDLSLIAKVEGASEGPYFEFEIFGKTGQYHEKTEFPCPQRGTISVKYDPSTKKTILARKAMGMPFAKTEVSDPHGNFFKAVYQYTRVLKLEGLKSVLTDGFCLL
ncbi:hypothetical protein HYY71_03085 [Candidatus Woesearchaeota archaeon]|nr:hypothetical protein [Candidatus Woesearchaeota archaeon]